ncbi:hypothetical protein PC128_g22134 [Phytophthora cactorum]|nr:hypothetical protein PC128_g22134 [Phytophthora cactorum]KAG4043217.1 hypothetical protein PC123_g21309 [Phytophthora cactorum]
MPPPRRRPLRALLDSGATNNFFRASCLPELPKSVRVRKDPGEVEVKLADGKPHRVARREVSLPYTFDGFRSKDDFLVIEMNYAFDCILGIPWLARYQPEIDWLARSVKRRRGFDVSEVFTHLLAAPRDWPHVTVVGKTATTRAVHRASDGPLCMACAVLLNEESSQRCEANEKVVEQGHGFPPKYEMAVERGLPQMNNTAVEHTGLSPPKTAVERVVLPHDDTAVEQVLPRVLGPVEQGLPRLEEGEASSSDSDSSSTSSCTRRMMKKSKRRRLKPRRGPPTESVCALEYVEGAPRRSRVIKVASPPRDAASIRYLPGLSWKHFLRDLKAVEIEQVCLITEEPSAAEALNATMTESEQPKGAEPKSAREERYEAQSWEALRMSGNPVNETVREFEDIFPEKIPAELPADRGVKHEIDLAPGTKYCVTRQWTLPREQVKAIDEFFESRRKVGHVRESISPHSSPTFCVKKATGGWRTVHAFNKLNDATIPAQTPIPRKDMMLDSMAGSVIYSVIDLTDGFDQILMRESDIPLTAASTPSGMLWEWLVMPQGLKNAPATFNRMVSHVLRPLRDFAPSYFDDIFVHSRPEGNLSAVEVHLRRLRQVFQVMRENKLYANLKKCAFCAPEISVLGCYVSKNGVRADPEKVSSICSWTTPKSPTELRQWLGMANTLHKYTKNYAGLIQPLSSLLKKDVQWVWKPEHQAAFDSVKKSLPSAPILMLSDDSKPFHVVCDASDFAIGSALMQFDDEGKERVVSYQSRQLKPAERNYPVHDKELLAMCYALIKFRVYLLGEESFAVYTDHASLRTAMKTPHLSQRMARWLSFFSDYSFVVHYKPGKNNILADALSRRPDYDPREALGHQATDADDDEGECAVCLASGINLTTSSPTKPLGEEIAAAYAADSFHANILEHLRFPSDSTWELFRAQLETRSIGTAWMEIY